jgi:hypothetical protein
MSSSDAAVATTTTTTDGAKKRKAATSTKKKLPSCRGYIKSVLKGMTAEDEKIELGKVASETLAQITESEIKEITMQANESVTGLSKTQTITSSHIQAAIQTRYPDSISGPMLKYATQHLDTFLSSKETATE